MFCDFFFFRKSCRLWDNVEKYDWAREAMGDSIIRRMRFAGCITKTEKTHSECVILIIYYFSTAAVVSPVRISVTLCIHCLSFIFMYEVAYEG